MTGAPKLLVVFWELTAQCNLRCQHCRAEAADASDHGELSTEELLQCARDIRAAGDPILILTGGEPLARPDFFTVAQACSELFSRVALATNGTLIDDGMARRVAASGIRCASLSLDGADAPTHDRFRGQAGSFEAALAGYDALRRAGMPMQINATLTPRNADQLEAMLELALRRGADAFHLFVLVPVGCGAEIAKAERLAPQRIEESLRWLGARSEELRDRIRVKATCAPQYYRILRQEGAQRGRRAPSGGPPVAPGCLAGSSVCFVSRRGDVQPCGYLPVRAGNVRSAAFSGIWRDADVFRALRDTDLLKGKCGVCGYRSVCGGCRARAHAATGDFLEAEPGCSHLPAAWRGRSASASQRKGESA